MSILQLVSFLSAVDGCWLSYPIFILSTLIIYLSLRVVPPSLSRPYCLNVAVPSFLSTLTSCALYVAVLSAMTMLSFYDITLFVLQTPKSTETMYGVPILPLYSFVRGFTLHGYIYFSTVTIFLAYLGYARPFLFQTLSSTKNIVLIFGFGYVWTTVAIVTLSPRYAFGSYGIVQVLGLSQEMNFSAMVIAQLTVMYGFYVTMVLLYIMAIVLVIRRVGNSTESVSDAVPWRVLRSLLIYCTPPNIFVALALVGHTCDATLEVHGYLKPSYVFDIFTDYCAPIRVWSQALTNVRLFVNAFTALIAFHDYRMTIINGVPRVVARILKTSRATSTSPSASTESRLFRRSTES
ncbi:hypothetical protein QR680_006214 [Steinernema hermaphroditum]|uniref:Uncharacterized protein n=1 Tax=Steinernema hermaphroditum TaxID=289476 RepID=A0AA39LX14_9BILA|nr:hypothetical protein QR680_006214 [Steinernema hermaphroditum]